MKTTAIPQISCVGAGLALVMGLALLAGCHNSDVRLWATGDCVRVNAETGKYFEDRTDIHADYPTGDYRSANPVWDAAKGKVTLHAARNEFVAFQLVVEAPNGASGLSVKLDKLTGPGGATISGRNLTLFKAWYVQVRAPSSDYEKTSLGKGWYADALIPTPAGQPVSVDIPDAANAIGPTQANQTIWVDVYVPRDRKGAPPGTYTGRIEVDGPAGKTGVAVALKVWDFALPDERHMPGDIWNGTLKKMDPQVELRYYQLARRHGFLPGVCYYRPQIKVDGTRVSIDWTEYDRRMGKYLDGTAFTEAYGYWGPGYGRPITHVILPFNANWPPTDKKEGTPEFEAVWTETAHQVRRHFEQNPAWRKVGKVTFIGALDEGYNQQTYDRMKYYSELLKPVLGGWHKFRIDGGYNSSAMRFLQPYVNLWVCTTAGFGEEKIVRNHKLGVDIWMYGQFIYERNHFVTASNCITDVDLLACRGPGWAAWKTKSGFCSWEFDCFFDGKVSDPLRAWKEAGTFRYRGQMVNGAGLMIYRGDFIGQEGPIPSIRLKAHRRGFQDYEYFWLLSQKTGGEAAADKLVDSIIPKWPFAQTADGQSQFGNVEIWKNNPEAWDAVRIEIGNRLGRAGGS